MKRNRNNGTVRSFILLTVKIKLTMTITDFEIRFTCSFHIEIKKPISRENQIKDAKLRGFTKASNKNVVDK